MMSVLDIQALKRLCTRVLMDLSGDYRLQSNLVTVFLEEAAPFHLKASCRASAPPCSAPQEPCCDAWAGSCESTAQTANWKGGRQPRRPPLRLTVSPGLAVGSWVSVSVWYYMPDSAMTAAMPYLEVQLLSLRLDLVQLLRGFALDACSLGLGRRRGLPAH